MEATKYLRILQNKTPDAVAAVRGSKKYPDIIGTVYFYRMFGGILVMADVSGLPRASGPCGGKVFGFHIHSGGKCSGTAEMPFANAGGHFNPGNCDHPRHAGDLPPLFGNNGNAWMAVLTDRFSVRSIIGKTVIIHSNPDDFTTQPSGNAGEMMACGEIKHY